VNVRTFGVVAENSESHKGRSDVTTVQEARPRVQRLLDRGRGFGQIEDEIEAIEGLDPEEKSALWVWAWTSENMGHQRYLARQGLAFDQELRHGSHQFDD
jgi:hypothetical protein